MTLTLRQFFPMCGFPANGGVDELRGLAFVLDPELASTFGRVSARDVMRRFSQIPENPDFTLDLNVDPTTGNPPLTVGISVGASTGASPVINTNLDVFDSAGKAIPGFVNHYLGGESLGPEGGSFGIGSYEVKAARTAATKHGPATLTRTADITVSKKVTPQPPPTPPSLSVTFSGTAAAAQFTVTGSGFLPNLQGTPTSCVAIRAVDVNSLQQVRDFLRTDGSGRISDGSGKASVVLTANLAGIPVNVVGEAIIVFSATDGRPGPTGPLLDGLLWSNPVTITLS